MIGDGMRSYVRQYDALPRRAGPPDAENRARIEATVALFPPDAGSVVDLGCGGGAVSRPLVARGVPVVGVDVSRRALARFEGPAVVASLDRLPFADGTFDGVLCAEVLEHVPEGRFGAAVAEVARVCRRYAVVTTPDDEYLPSGHARCRRGHVFHKNLHWRSLDWRDHRRLLPGMECARTITIGRTVVVPLLILAQQRLFGTFAAAPGVACPYCGAASAAAARPGPVARALLRVCGRVGRPWQRRRGRWLASLYRRNGAGGPDGARGTAGR